MIDVRIAATAEERDDAFAVRIAVFVDEQGIPRSEELDELDASAVHCVAYDGRQPVGAGRLVIADGYAKVGRMAVLRERRRNGVGALVLAALEREAASRGVREVRLSAQLTARAFYERNGYTASGDVYDEVGIPHIAMVKRLAK
ncbi:MAG TPA: GNAT family N-acetyltransferase [Dehalococcoidia bacterium]|nr:GNAT family N-acetyltransferase [Dehalococcoidia bacterium]